MTRPDPWWKRAQFISVHDGDTVVMRRDYGEMLYSEKPLRLDGCNAPELGSASGARALAYTQQWFAQHAGCATPKEKWPFDVRSKRDVTTYNRFVGRVYCAKGHSLVTDLLASGNAEVYPKVKP